MKKKIGIIISLVVVIALAVDITAAVYLFNTTIVREHASAGRAQSFTGVDWEIYGDIRDEMQRTFAESKAGEYYIESDDGLNLYGQYFESPAAEQSDYIDGAEPALKRVAICFHGYTGYGGGNSSAAAMFFLNNGFDVLIPDARAHGQSEGDYVGFGCLDRFDGLKWVEFIQDLYRPEADAGRLEIYLYGTSMGGATVCMMSSLDLPDSVKGIVSDCAFTSPEEIFGNILRSKYYVPSTPILFVANILCQNTAGYSLDECNSAEEVKYADIPMLFIHGSADSFIPVEMCYEIYENCASRKDILIVDGAAHVESYYKARDQYEQKLKEFLGI